MEQLVPSCVMSTDEENHESLSSWSHQQDLEQQEQLFMKMHEMITSKYLQQKDVGKGLLVTVKNIARINIAKANEPPQLEFVMYFHEIDKPLVLKTTNKQLCFQTLGEDSDFWPNKKLVLYTDPTVIYAGKITGGIRIRAPRTNPGISSTATVQSVAAPAEAAAPEFDDDIPW